jgi:hypothetical protein
LKTWGFDTLGRTILFVEGTIEELIAAELHFGHQYDVNGRFVGPVFSGTERMIFLVQNSPDFVVGEDD